ncbi:3-(methylthio)propionyl-CoA ligase [Rhodococcus sp. CSLK01-03]|uniref:3-(Methylthio)propionyl-CoA ligase n=1 Tax=Rhodococcus indonesiensis TaxID=3055869 RepID=A0ABT7RRH1_9NOCA|nr:3-(methylthio)propionyl-CoA ligase [Rhodococcus indonesiensis]MDM7489869.1 3-(methylthio)propionyl-CoA ligase [Rhodococcus indonesiensis]
MIGQMMQQPLLISSLLRHAERHHSRQEIVSRRVEGDIHRYTFRDLADRSRRLAQALGRLGVEPGSRVATLAWNGYRHLELYYAASGSGAVLHTVNPRLHPDQMEWIITDAADDVLFFDLTFLPLVRELAPRLASVRHFVVMSDRDHLPGDTDEFLAYEDLVGAESGDYRWPTFDENTASSLCYTSGTTGNPKGVLYSHRSTLLHTFAVSLPDSMGLSARDTVMPVVPMFHVNAWGLPYAACMVGAKVVFPGADLDGRSLYELQETEQVTLSASVPTVWQGQLQYAQDHGVRFTALERAVIGGAACPPSMLRRLEQEYGVTVIHGWGMTETSPFGTASVPKPSSEGLTVDERLAVQAKQGRCVFGMDLKIVDDAGNELPWDGSSAGHLHARGPWVLETYYHREDIDPLVDGWFPTGDIATIDADGFMQITDRSKDVIKSGGEWISSIDLENLAMNHPGVAAAACIGVRHRKWDERPLLVVVRTPEADLTAAELLDFFDGRIAKWWLPDDVVFVEALPMGSTGKVLKAPLREQFRDHLTTARTTVPVRPSTP